MIEQTICDVQLLLGNEAIALGAYHAGVSVATGYPGTPSTETLEYLARIAPAAVSVGWSTNEKVALDVGIGAALGGARALVTMKHVGLNVAMDSWMTSAFVGVNGGLVVLSADDPGMHSSQNEQDNRKCKIRLETQQDYGVKNGTGVVSSTVVITHCGGPKDAALYGTINDLLSGTQRLDQCPDCRIYWSSS